VHARLLFAAKLLLALFALAYLADRIAWGELWATARTAQPLWILAALALMPFNIGLEAYRWHRLVRRLAPETTYRTSLAAVLSGYPLGLVTPARAGDYAGRALYLSYPRKGELVALTFAERMATLACTLVVGLVAMVPFLLTQSDLPGAAWATLFGAAALGTVGFVFLLLHPGVASRFLTSLLPFRSVRRLLTVLDRFDRNDARSLLLLSGLRYGIFSLQFVLLVVAFEPAAPWLAVAIGVALVFFAKSAIPSFTLGDLGIREGAAVFFLGALGIASAAAFEASLVLFGINLLLPALIGLPFVLRLRLPVPAAQAAPDVRPATVVATSERP
jgi:uncharacterized membrane protein YbhN (UPF0104 family)